jgi:hypothetical protein
VRLDDFVNYFEFILHIHLILISVDPQGRITAVFNWYLY